MIRHETVEDHLTRLASGEPTPGGGATGALVVAQGAGLVAMAARFSGREDVAVECERVIRDGLAISDEDEQGFAAVADAYALPKGGDAARARRSAAVQAALDQAVRPPRAIVDAVDRTVSLAERVLDDANPHVLSDVGAALGCARAGAGAAVVTLLTNLSPLHDEQLGAELRAEIARADGLTSRIDALAARVRERIAR
ncbi:cyclodeaminase/cyclohydrolase family protein [Micrococcus porci]|uniref:cyclodeaminase/cyclohydrolase family protein n=1 Tax=Micrococcus porci TaxID=2856555 RepID=UPI003CEE9535